MAIVAQARKEVNISGTGIRCAVDLEKGLGVLRRMQWRYLDVG